MDKAGRHEARKLESVESPSKSVHQIMSVIQAAEPVGYIQEQTFVKEGLEREYGI